MKKFIALGLAGLLVASTPLLPENAFREALGLKLFEKTEAVSVDGAAAISKIREAYERGDYDDFLTEREKAYQEAQESGAFEEFLAMRAATAGEASPLTHNFDQERNQALLDLLSVKDSSPLAEKIRSAARSFDKSQEASFAKMASLHALSVNNPENSSEENELAALDAAYEYKLFSLHTKGKTARDLPIVLLMDRMHHMESSARFFEDPSWKKAVFEAGDCLDALLAKQWDLADLYLLSGEKPASPLEEELQGVLQK